MTHPRIYPHLTHDWSPSPDDFKPNVQDSIHFLLAKLGETILGLYVCHPIISPLSWQVHHAILPSALAWSQQIAEVVEHYLFTKTPCETIVGFTPSYNRLALRYAKRTGCVETGRIPGGFKKDGKVCDIVVFSKQKQYSGIIA